MEKLISFRNFSFRYKTQQEATLKNIDLDIYKGETLLILGASGSGKSTLAKCLNGLIPHQFKGYFEGELDLFGKSYQTQNIFSLSHHIGSVLQDTDAQFVSHSVEEDIAFVLENNQVEVSKMKLFVQKAAQRVGVDHLLKAQPFHLSGGQKQRVAMAGVLHHDIDLLLLDEPLAALDPKMGEYMIELLESLKNEGKTLVLIEHRLEEVLHRSVDRIVLMHDGGIVGIYTPDDLLASELLNQYGIREPLYLSAAKHFLKCSQKQHLSSLNTLNFEPYALQIENLKKELPRSFTFEEKKANTCLLHLKNAYFSYDEKPFMEIKDLKIYEGERIALLGANGSGKSTLAKIFTGLLNLKSGTIERLGKVMTIKEISTLIAYVMQNPNQMLVSTSLYEEVALSLRLHHFSEEEIESKVHQVLKLTGLYEMRFWPTSVLSYGQKKRLTVAVVLALNPKCILLDEPTAGQDYAHYREMMEFIDELNKQYGICVIFITHDMHLALEYTDRSLVLEQGKLLKDAPTFDVLDDEALLQVASLKKSSLFKMAEQLNLPKYAFLKAFIQKEKEFWKHGL